MSQTRIEHDALGPVELAVDAAWGAQTQRAVNNFPISGYRLPRDAIRALGAIKAAAARAHSALGTLPADRANAIIAATEQVESGAHDAAFPVDVFQTGSGTSSNMNANEVIARLANQLVPELDPPIHPNDDVNRGQSSNDVIPSAARLATLWGLREHLIPALTELSAAFATQAARHRDVVTVGRTHLMDAVPMTYGQIFGGYASQLADSVARLEAATTDLALLPLGGTAVGTGLNAPPGFGDAAIATLAASTGLALKPCHNRFAAQGGIDALVHASGCLRGAALTLSKPAEDLRWLASGPRFGLAEIRLPALQPGSSIMPGKVNPVIEEAVLQVCCHVIGGDAAISAAGLTGHFALHTTLPLLLWQLPEHCRILANAATTFAARSVSGLTVASGDIAARLARHPVLATALVPRIGHEAAVAIAQAAASDNRSVIDVAAEHCDIPRAELEDLLDPLALAHPPGWPGGQQDFVNHT
ncbi:MAG: class II fumarate hydratase [Planctomycetota bacterium]|jgi:fumarate hydratase class II|nr:class II fumarate hydratase [Planctomycetota bacterium]